VKFTTVKNLITSTASRQVLKIQKHSPVLLFSAGVVGVVGAAVLASRATLKLDDILVDAQYDLEKVRSLESAKYSEEDRTRDKTIVYVRTGVRIARIYAPAVGVGVLSIVALTGSHVILSRRNAAITAAYAILDKGFREYRRRVEDAYGSDRERELRYGLVERDIYDDESGKVVTVKDYMPHGSIYARCFDETNQNWNKTHMYNQMFLASQQQYCNDKLRAQGHLFLNEVYDMLGMERSKEGAVVGWLWGPESDFGDNYVDFGIFVGNREQGMRFARGYERSIWLDFNVDGIIYDKI